MKKIVFVLMAAVTGILLLNPLPVNSEDHRSPETAVPFSSAENEHGALTKAAPAIAKAAAPSRKGFSIHKISKKIARRITGRSYLPNTAITLSELRYIKVRHYGYDGKIKNGELIVNKRIAKDIVAIFHDLYAHKYPIQQMVLIDQYQADDQKSMEANNTTAFNYRQISGSKSLSRHAYGMAIDINPRINPCVKNGRTSPENGRVYAQRNVKRCKGTYRKNMIHRNDYIYHLFKKRGFTWGGDWRSFKDYQHFEKRR